MRTAAIDMSSSVASLALLEGEDILSEVTWTQSRDAGQPLFEHLKSQMAQTDWGFDDIDCFVAGRGPGMYSGLRISLTAFQAFALPDEKQVFTVNSGVGIAAAVFENVKAKRVAVVGDARRDLLWYGIFDKVVGVPMLDGEWGLAAPGELPEKLAGKQVVCASSVLSGLKEKNWFDELSALDWLEQDIHPQAGRMGVEAVVMMQRGMVSESCTPVYMHPPVAVVKVN